MLYFHVISLFPKSIDSYLSASIIGRARGVTVGKNLPKPLIDVRYYNPKNYSRDKYGRVDRRPYGGGPGMVLEPDAILLAIEDARKFIKRSHCDTLIFATDGAQFDELMAENLAIGRSKTGKALKNSKKNRHIILICGRYEGIDERVKIISKAIPVTVGPYVLTGGELPAAIVIDAVSRFVPGVLGKFESLERKRISSPHVYTRPEIFVWKKKKYKVPAVLLSGNHAVIDKWKSEN